MKNQPSKPAPPKLRTSREERNEYYVRRQMHRVFGDLLHILQPTEQLVWGSQNYAARLEHVHKLLTEELVSLGFLGEDKEPEAPALEL